MEEKETFIKSFEKITSPHTLSQIMDCLNVASGPIQLMMRYSFLWAPIASGLLCYSIGKQVERSRSKRNFNEFNRHMSRLKHLEKEIYTSEVRLQYLIGIDKSLKLFYLVFTCLVAFAVSVSFYIDWYAVKATFWLLALFILLGLKFGTSLVVKLKTKTIEKMRNEEQEINMKRRKSIQSIRKSFDASQMKIIQEELKNEHEKEKSEIQKELTEVKTKQEKIKEEMEDLNKEKLTLSSIFTRVLRFDWCNCCRDFFEESGPGEGSKKKQKPERGNQIRAGLSSANLEEEILRADDKEYKPASPGTVSDNESLAGGQLVGCQKQCTKHFYWLCNRLSIEYQSLQEILDRKRGRT